MGACRWSIMNVRTWGVSSSFTPILCYQKFSSATSHSRFRGRSSATKTCRVQLETRIAWGSHRVPAIYSLGRFFCAATFPDPAPNLRKHRPGVILESKKLGRCCLEPKNRIINAAPRSSSMCPVRAGKSSRAGHVRGQFFPPFPRVSSLSFVWGPGVRCVSRGRPCVHGGWWPLPLQRCSFSAFGFGEKYLPDLSHNMFYSDTTMFHQNACNFLFAKNIFVDYFMRKHGVRNDTLCIHCWHKPNDRKVGSATSPESIHIGDVAENVSCPMVHCFATWTAPVAHSVVHLGCGGGHWRRGFGFYQWWNWLRWRTPRTRKQSLKMDPAAVV
jgi:hypothetical protein